MYHICITYVSHALCVAQAIVGRSLKSLGDTPLTVPDPSLVAASPHCHCACACGSANPRTTGITTADHSQSPRAIFVPDLPACHPSLAPCRAQVTSKAHPSQPGGLSPEGLRNQINASLAATQASSATHRPCHMHMRTTAHICMNTRIHMGTSTGNFHHLSAPWQTL